MELIKTEIEGVFIIKHGIFGDSRGFFMETYNQRHFFDVGINDQFVQDNLSKSMKGVVRGLHFQNPPFSQAKLLRMCNLLHVVGERSVSLRRWLVKAAGGIRSANADMSSVKGGEKPPRRKRKVFYATFIGVE